MFKFLKSSLCLMLSLIFFNTNQPLYAAQNSSLMTSMDMVNQFDRENIESDLLKELSSKEAQMILAKNGFNPEQIQAKMASLSNQELINLQSDIKQAQAGGILATILIVILIIYFAQRI